MQFVLTSAVLCCAMSCPAPPLTPPQPLSESITSLHDAAKWGDRDAVERLLNEGADVNGVVRDSFFGGRKGGGGQGTLVCSRLFAYRVQNLCQILFSFRGGRGDAQSVLQAGCCICCLGGSGREGSGVPHSCCCCYDVVAAAAPPATCLARLHRMSEASAPWVWQSPSPSPLLPHLTPFPLLPPPRSPPKKPNTSKQNERGISPLGVAVGFNRAPVVGLLLDAGADLEARDAAGNTVLHYAAGEAVSTLYNLQ